MSKHSSPGSVESDELENAFDKPSPAGSDTVANSSQLVQEGTSSDAASTSLARNSAFDDFRATLKERILLSARRRLAQRRTTAISAQNGHVETTAGMDAASTRGLEASPVASVDADLAERRQLEHASGELSTTRNGFNATSANLQQHQSSKQTAAQGMKMGHVHEVTRTRNSHRAASRRSKVEEQCDFETEGVLVARSSR